MEEGAPAIQCLQHGEYGSCENATFSNKGFWSRPANAQHAVEWVNTMSPACSRDSKCDFNARLEMLTQTHNYTLGSDVLDVQVV